MILGSKVKLFCSLSDILYDDLPTPVLKSFDDLIAEFGIPYYIDRQKHNIFFNVNCGNDFEGH